MPAAWGMGGLVGPDRPRASETAAIFADLRREPVLRTSVRPNPLQDDSWATARPEGVARVDRLAHVLDLDGGFDNVWQHRFKSVARTAVRKAEKAGLKVECDTTGRLLPGYYRLYELSLERWAQHQHEPRALANWRGRRRDPQSKLAAISRVLGESCQIWLASLDGTPIAGIIVLRGVNAHYTRGAMDISRAGPTRANYLLQKLAIEDACAHGCRRYHMGESGTSDQLAQYKTRFGAAPVTYGEYHVERLPLTAADRRLRGVVKNAIGFRD
jgi:lipid II:glycine glycyltransferase (peptidoglycan interpeptide bridge formation enzyme)